MFVVAAVALIVARREGVGWRALWTVALTLSFVFAALQILDGNKIASQRDFPVLIFKGYRASAKQTARFAKLELQNRSTTPIWLWVGGEEYPFRPNFLERPLAPVFNVTGQSSNHLFSVRLGSFFSMGERLSPGDTMALEYPLIPEKPPEQVGVSYYYGNFKVQRQA